MSTSPAVPVENGFQRWIDAIGRFFIKAAPVVKEVEAVAIAAEPFLALTPFGPEYNLVLNAIVGVQKSAEASLAAGASLNGAQKMALVIQSVTPGVSAILASKGVTSNIPAIVAAFAQNVYNMDSPSRAGGFSFALKRGALPHKGRRQPLFAFCQAPSERRRRQRERAARVDREPCSEDKSRLMVWKTVARPGPGILSLSPPHKGGCPPKDPTPLLQ